MPHAAAQWAAEDSSDEELRGCLAEFVGELAGERRCLRSGLRTGPPDRRQRSRERELCPVRLRGQGRPRETRERR